MPTELESRQLFTELKSGDRIEVVHEVKVGSSKTWSTHTVGTVMHTERRRQGIDFRRHADDKVFADMIILKRDDGEETTLTMDEFTELKRVS
jgi:hypothetical protein